MPAITLIAGPTASGKSALALARARESGAVIVNADSQQLYADLRVLSARPSAHEESLAVHRLYGIADGAEAWSVGRWQRAAMGEIETARSEGRPVIIVGGTGLYFRALTHGLAEVPAVPDALRDALTQEFDVRGEDAMRAELRIADPAAEARIMRGDRQRLVRALAVARHTGRSLSDWQNQTTAPLPENSFETLLLLPEREALYARCDLRAEQMMQQGALEEVERLLARELPPELPVMKAVGVRELAAHLKGEITKAEALDRLKTATRQYAKRQMTWFRNQTPHWPRAQV